MISILLIIVIISVTALLIGMLWKKQYLLFFIVVILAIVSLSFAILSIFYGNEIFYEGVVLDRSIGYFGALGLPSILFYWEWKRNEDEKKRLETEKNRLKDEKDKKTLYIKNIIISSIEDGYTKYIGDRKRLDEEEAEKEQLETNECSIDFSPQAFDLRTDGNSIASEMWGNINKYLKMKKLDQITLNCIYKILIEIQFYLESRNPHRLGIKVEFIDNIEAINTYLKEVIKNIESDKYDLIIYNTIKGKLLEEQD